jgi:hypothetical protein
MDDRVDFTKLLSVDVLLLIILQLDEPRHVLACAHVNRAFRRAFFVRNAFGYWHFENLSRVMGNECLVLPSELYAELYDLLVEPLPTACSLMPYISWSFVAKKRSAEDVFAHLTLGRSNEIWDPFSGRG